MWAAGSDPVRSGGEGVPGVDVTGVRFWWDLFRESLLEIASAKVPNQDTASAVKRMGRDRVEKEASRTQGPDPYELCRVDRADEEGDCNENPMVNVLGLTDGRLLCRYEA